MSGDTATRILKEQAQRHLSMAMLAICSDTLSALEHLRVAEAIITAIRH